MDLRAVLGGLDERQREAVTSPAAPLAVVAPAGSGKTRVLTARIANRIATGDADAAHVLCVTFTRKAARELHQRLEKLGLRERIEAGTFHSIALSQLRARWEAAGREPPRLLDRIAPVLAETAPALQQAQLREVATEMGWARARCLSPDDYVDASRSRRTRLPAATIAETWADFDAAKASRHLVDFDDLLAACTAAIDGDAAFGAAQRWRFRHLFVDEFQDVNPLQFRLLEAWRGDRWDVCVVGDPHQSIYGWNGADPTLLDTLHDRWPALETVYLDRTHRSTPEIAAAAAAVVRAGGLRDRVAISTGRAGPVPRIHEHDDALGEAVAVATAIRRRRDPGSSWRRFAVLARTQAEVTELERALGGMGLPVYVRRTTTSLSDPAVRRVLARMAMDDRALLGILDDVADAQEARLGAVRDLLDTAEDFLAIDEAATGRTFAAWARANLVDDEPPDAVALSTIHAAKGLEWDVVHVVGVEDGSIPHIAARKRAERDEEARLLYVAITRAAAEVHLHWARTREVRGRTLRRERSPFLEGFEDAMAALPAEDQTPGTAQLAAMRARLSPPSLPDPTVARLQAWRSRRSSASGTPAEALLPDDVIVRLAHERPATLDELGRVTGLGPARLRRYGDELLATLVRR